MLNRHPRYRTKTFVLWNLKVISSLIQSLLTDIYFLTAILPSQFDITCHDLIVNSFDRAINNNRKPTSVNQSRNNLFKSYQTYLLRPVGEEKTNNCGYAGNFLSYIWTFNAMRIEILRGILSSRKVKVLFQLHLGEAEREEGSSLHKGGFTEVVKITSKQSQ